MSERIDPRRAREILRIAADATESDEVKAWLTWDEKGTWEKTVGELFEIAQQHPGFGTLSAPQVNGEIADMVRFYALSAAINTAKRART